MISQPPAGATEDVVAVIPAAGSGSRLGTVRFSKELYPLISVHGSERFHEAKSVCEHLFECLRRARVRKAMIILRDGKWDIPSAFGDGSDFGLSLAYQIARWPFGVPFTIDEAYQYTRNSSVALGFPDIVFEPRDAFSSLFEALEATSANVVLGLFPTDSPKTADVVDVRPDGSVSEIHIKSDSSARAGAWAIAVWTPVFSEFLHQYCQEFRTSRGGVHEPDEVFVGDALNAAIRADVAVSSVSFPNGWFIDIGTPSGLRDALDRL